MIPDNSRKKLEQLRQEAALRAQLQQQYDKDMKKVPLDKMIPFTQWMDQRNKPMAKGGKVFKQETRDRNLKKFLDESKEKRRLYHGTQKDFGDFKSGYHGVFLTPDPEFSEEFSTPFNKDPEGGRTMPVHVQVKDPFDYENAEHRARLRKAAQEVHGSDKMHPYIEDLNDRWKKHNWERMETWAMMDPIKHAGFDSYYVSESGRKNLAVFDPKKIKSAIGNRGTYNTNLADINKATGGAVEPSQDEMRLALSKTKRHGMYSPLEKAAIDIPRAKGTGAEFMAEISKRPGFKAEEVADRKIPIPEGKMTKLEFLKHLRQHSLPPLTEHTLDDLGDIEEALNDRANDYYGDDIDRLSPEQQRDVENWVEQNSIQYKKYQLPGGENYREILLKLPALSNQEKHMIMELEAQERRVPPSTFQHTAEGVRLQKLRDKQRGIAGEYHSNHWSGHPNVLAHVRLSDREGPEGEKLLHLEELQSDWHQRGRKKGYKTENDPLKKNENGEYVYTTPDGNQVNLGKYINEQKVREGFGLSNIPNAPFKKSWQELGMKHVLHHAAKHGYHGVVITPGEEQAKRWNDERLKTRYDKNIPEFLNKFGKPFGVQVGKHVIDKGGYKVNRDTHEMPYRLESEGSPDIISRHPTAESAWNEAERLGSVPLHHFPITEPMRTSILKEGMPQYMRGGVVHKAEGGAVLPIEQMRNELMNKTRFSSLSQLQNIGAEEAPSLNIKAYVPPMGRPDNGQIPVGGVNTSQGNLPVGGIDMNQQQQGQQLMPNAPPTPPGTQPGMDQVPMGDKIPTIDSTTNAPAPNFSPGKDGSNQKPPIQSNILSMTPQGQAMKAMQPQGLANGGTPKKITKRDQTVKNAQRMAYPGIYGNPKEIAALAASRVAPEDPLLKDLFGVTRADMYQLTQGRKGAPHLGMLPGMAANPKGSASAEGVMNKRNEQRLLDVMGEAGKHQSLVHGMDPWYYMDPLFQRMVQLLGLQKATEEYKKMNALMGMASSSSEVNTEIPRGSLAYVLQNQGRFDEFVKHGGKRDPNRPADFGETPGHLAHKTAHALPMQKFLERGEVDMNSPKVPMYIEASGVPVTGFQTRTPVGDAHWSRAVGLADTRNPKTSKGKEVVPGQSVSTPEMSSLGPWWQQKIAAQLGLESVPAQARAWGAFSPQTGVTTPIGAPKLELIAKQIGHTAQRLGVTPQTARDLVLTGKERMGYKAGGKVKLNTDQDTMRLTLSKKSKKAK